MYWIRVSTSFGKRFGSSSGHNWNSFPNLVPYSFQNMFQKESIIRFSTVTKGGSKVHQLSSRRARKYLNGFDIDSMTHVIIGRTISLVLGPWRTPLRRLLMHCTLTYKTAGTIWWDLFKPPQRRHGHYSRPIVLLFGTPTTLGPQLKKRLRVAQPTPVDVTIYFRYNVL